MKKHFPILLILLMSFILRSCGMFWLVSSKNDHPLPYHLDEGTALTIMSHMKDRPLSPAYQFPSLKGLFYYYFSAGAGYAAYVSLPFLKKYIPSFDSFKRFENSYSGIYALLSGRFVSVVASTLSIFIMYLCLLLCVPRMYALVGAFLISITPGIVIHSHFLSCNSFLLMWILLSFYFTLRILKKPLLKDYILAGLCAGCASASKYPGVLSIIPMATAHLFLCFSALKDKDINAFKRLSLFGLIYLFIIPLTILVASPPMILEYNRIVPGDSKFSILFNSLMRFNFDILTPLNTTIWGMGGTVFIVFIVGFLLKLFKNKWHDYELVALSFIIPFIILFSCISAVASTSRLLPLYVIIIFLTVSFMHDFNRFAIIKKPLVKLLCLILIVFPPAFFSVYLQLHYMQNPLHAATSEWIKNNIPRNSTLGIFYPPLYVDPGIIFTNYHQKGSHWELTDKRYRVILIDSLEKIRDEDIEYVLSFGERQDFPQGSSMRSAFIKTANSQGFSEHISFTYDDTGLPGFLSYDVIHKKSSLDYYTTSPIVIYKKTD